MRASRPPQESEALHDPTLRNRPGAAGSRRRSTRRAHEHHDLPQRAVSRARRHPPDPGGHHARRRPSRVPHGAHLPAAGNVRAVPLRADEHAAVLRRLARGRELPRHGNRLARVVRGARRHLPRPRRDAVRRQPLRVRPVLPPRGRRRMDAHRAVRRRAPEARGRQGISTGQEGSPTAPPEARPCSRRLRRETGAICAPGSNPPSPCSKTRRKA